MTLASEQVMFLPGAPGWKSGLLEPEALTDTATFANPLYHGADPWVTRHDGLYYLCQTGPGGCIEVWKSDTLTHRGERQVVWTPPRKGWNRDEVWAPELHLIGDRWYIYYAASDGHNRNHRMGVLESVTDDPQGEYIDRGQLYTGDDVTGGADNRWAIDGTILQLRGQLYFIWSGWADERDIQHLYIARMSDPVTIASNRVRLCDNDSHLWERVGESNEQRGLNEGPQLLVRHGRIFLIYSCSGSWQATYKLGMLCMNQTADPMNSANWRKSRRPVFESTREIFGVGHCCFTHSSDGEEDWILYHAKRDRREGWDRVVRAQPFEWQANGFPHFGAPSEAAELAVPSGDPGRDNPSTRRPPMPRAA